MRLKELISFLAIICGLFLLVGCDKMETISNQDKLSMFVIIKDFPGFYVIYDRDTKVMYAVSTGSYNNGNFTLLVNADGTPRLYDEE